MPDRRVFATAVACVLCVATSIRVRGAEAEFTLDPAASRFTVGGSIDGRTLGDQTPGSTTTAVTGTLFLDIDRTAGTVSLVRGLPRLELQPQPQRPHRDMPGPGPAVFGMAAGPDTDPLLASIASMSVAFGLDDAPYNGRPPRRFEEFFFGVNDGSLYYTIGGGASSHVDLHGRGGDVPEADPLTLTVSGDTETLTIPLRTTFSVPNAGDEVILTLNARFVATRIVPEPASLPLLALAGTGTAALLRRRATRRRAASGGPFAAGSP